MASNMSDSEEIEVGEFGMSEDPSVYKNLWSVDGEIEKIKIKTRDWRNGRIIGGFQVHLKNGFAEAYGMAYNDYRNITTLEVPTGLRISSVLIASDQYIHALGFVLDNGEILGPVGEENRELKDISSRLQKDLGKFYLSGISGGVVRIVVNIMKFFPIIGEVFTAAESVVCLGASGVAALCGDDKAANELLGAAGNAWVDYAENNMIATPINGIICDIKGDHCKSEKLKEKYGENWSNLADGTPVVGHIKGVVHYAKGDKEKGHKAMESATRTTAVLGAGVLTGNLKQ
ncbi:unnamed protein product, partial [Cyprideis torosa]